MGGMAGGTAGGTASGTIACQNCGTSNRADATFCNTCGMLLPGATPPTTSPSPTVAPQSTPRHGTGRLPPQSRLAGHYLILKNVGQGGMAAVYRATDLRSGRVVAVKEMGQDGLSPDELKEALESFRFEAKTLTRLRHPNLPRVYQQFSEGARHYLVMEFIEGQTLEERLGAVNGAGLSETEVLGWARQLCSVLSYLHSQQPPIIFRDLKPSNVMVTKTGEVKLIDFGIARVFAPGRTRDTQVLGTPGYAPPEQYGKAQTDARADIYALGCTLYQLLTGYDPATTPFALPPLHSRSPRVAPHIQLAIERATRLDRDARYPTIAAFEQDLLRPAGLYFRNGECARNRAELVALCLRQPVEGAEQLYSGRIEGWLRAWGDIDAADYATRAVRFNADHAAGLRAFAASLSSSPSRSSSSYTRPNWGGTGNSASSYTSPAASPGYASPRSRSATATRAAASAAAAAPPVVVVQPRSISFGRLVAGQRGSQPFIVSAQPGQPGGSVSGQITALVPWLMVDKAQFSGASTLVQVWAETSRMAGIGVQQGNLQISCAGQFIYLPVTVEVLPAGGPATNSSPTSTPSASPASVRANPATPSVRGWNPFAGASTASGAAPSAWQTASQATAGARPATPTHPVSPKYALATPKPSRLVRLASSFVLALGLVAFALTQLPPLLARVHFDVTGGWPQTLLMLVIAGLLAIPGAWAGSPPWRAQGKLRATAIGAAAGFLAALLTTGPVVFTHNGELLLAALVGVGATFGADSLGGRAILATAAFVTRRIRVFLLLAAMIGGAWAGATMAGRTGVGLLVPMGLIFGICAGAWMGATLNQLLSRMTRSARVYP